MQAPRQGMMTGGRGGAGRNLSQNYHILRLRLATTLVAEAARARQILGE